MERSIAARADLVAVYSAHGVQAHVSGRDITVKGFADGPEEHAQLLESFQNVDGNRVVRDEISVLPVADPFETFGAKTADGVRVSGLVPTEADRRILIRRGVAGAETLTLAAGAPPGWRGAVDSANAALATLEFGAWSLNGPTLRFSGEARTPSERTLALVALRILPAGFDMNAEITMQDDGSPPAFVVMWDAAKGASVSGKLPFGMAPQDLSAPLGLASVPGDAVSSLVDFDRDEDILSTLAKLRPWLPHLEQARLTVEPDGVTLGGEGVPGADVELLSAAMAEVLDAKVQLDPVGTLPPEGTSRANAATGQSERLLGGHWLPVIDFSPGIASCQDQSDQALGAAQIQFLTGSSRLAPTAVAVVNRVAAVLRPCILEAGLSVELGGHTDATGDPEANMRLSLERAQAVRSALVQRGLPATALQAAGYGATQPIADNATEAGRAQNRRTTILWQTGP